MEIKRKGIIFALDAALAVSVVIIILINSSYYFSTSSKESLSQLQPVRIGSDVIALLDFGGSFDYAFAQDLEGHGDTIPQDNLNISPYLPKNYAMRYAITDMKETPTTETFCPDGGSNANCQTAPGVDCTSTGCILDQNEWVKIKPITEPTRTANIINQGPHFVSFGTTATTSAINATIEVDGNWTEQLVTLDDDTGIFLWGRETYFPYFEPGDRPYNLINITNTGTQPLTVKWVRVVGDESYMRGAYSEGDTSIPIDRFVGTGERFIAVLEPDGDFEGYHLVRYWVWLKTVSVT